MTKKRERKKRPATLARLYFRLKNEANALYERAHAVAVELVAELGHGAEIHHRPGKKAVTLDNFIPTEQGKTNPVVFRAHGIRRFELVERKR